MFRVYWIVFVTETSKRWVITKEERETMDMLTLMIKMYEIPHISIKFISGKKSPFLLIIEDIFFAKSLNGMPISKIKRRLTRYKKIDNLHSHLQTLFNESLTKEKEML